MKKLFVFLGLVVSFGSIFAQTSNRATFVNTATVTVLKFDPMGHDLSCSSFAPYDFYLKVEDTKDGKGQELKFSFPVVIGKTKEVRVLRGRSSNFYCRTNILTLELDSEYFSTRIEDPMVIVLQFTGNDEIALPAFLARIPVAK